MAKIMIEEDDGTETIYVGSLSEVALSLFNLESMEGSTRSGGGEITVRMNFQRRYRYTSTIKSEP